MEKYDLTQVSPTTELLQAIGRQGLEVQVNYSDNLATWRGVPLEKCRTKQCGLDQLYEALRSIAEGVSAVAENEVDRANGFRGLSSSTQYASNTIDRLALWREEYDELGAGVHG